MVGSSGHFQAHVDAAPLRVPRCLHSLPGGAWGGWWGRQEEAQACDQVWGLSCPQVIVGEANRERGDS